MSMTAMIRSWRSIMIVTRMSLVRVHYRQSADLTWVLYLLAMHTPQPGLCMLDYVLHISTSWTVPGGILPDSERV